MRSDKTGAGPAERLARNDTAVVIGAVAVIVFLSALYTIFGLGMQMSAIDMTRMAGPLGRPMSMGAGPAWTPAYALLVFLMWWIMMIAMMTPSAAPMLLLYTAVKRSGPEAPRAARLSLLFLAGYLLAWAAFSVIAATLQFAAETAGLVSGRMMTLRSPGFAGAVLLAAGLYQLTPLKQACLRHCRAPAHFLSAHRRPGATGALRMGAHHGLYCLGCCWALMALLFVGGIMNLYWIAGLALYVLAEKLAPNARLFSRVTGVALIAAGLALLIAG